MTEIIGVVAIASIAIRMRNALSRKRTVRKRTILLLMVSMVKTFFFLYNAQPLTGIINLASVTVKVKGSLLKVKSKIYHCLGSYLASHLVICHCLIEANDSQLYW